jgi:hypothetical protein
MKYDPGDLFVAVNSDRNFSYIFVPALGRIVDICDGTVCMLISSVESLHVVNVLCNGNWGECIKIT